MTDWLVDTHCHLQDDLAVADTLVERMEANRTRVVLMGTQPPTPDDAGDWDRVSSLCKSARAVVAAPGYGVHPWYAHKHVQNQASWLGDLERRLLEDPRAIVGEIGLDRVARVPGTNTNAYEAAQVPVFEAQMALAGRLARPVSMHCVKAYGQLLDRLKMRDKPWAPRVSIHSCTGSPDIVKALQQQQQQQDRNVVDLYFGFSSCVCQRRRHGDDDQKLWQTIATVRDDRLLLESDRASIEPVAAELHAMAALFAEVKGWSASETVDITTRNANRFLCG